MIRGTQSRLIIVVGLDDRESKTVNGDNPLWYDCDEEVPQKRTSSRVTRVAAILALLAAAYLVYRVLL